MAEKLQESSDSLTASDIRTRLSDAVRDCCRAAGSWGYYIDHIGDAESGDVIYCCGDDMYQAPYEMASGAGSAKCLIDSTKAIDVVPRTIWEPEMDEQDHYAAMEAAKLYTAGPVPLCERFIGKSERDNADSKSFAGKGKSYPILKKEDVKAAIHSLGRAGPDNYSIAVIKKNIKRIATEKGWGSELPTAWADGEQGHQGETEEAKRAREAAAAAHVAEVELTLREMAEAADATVNQGKVIEVKEGAVGQDGTVFIKVISPGWGSSGYYSPEVLERDLPAIYPKGTKMFWNHQTAAEEAARPEGDLRDLASVTTEAVKYLPNGPDGPGGYVKAKAFEAYKQPIEDLHKDIGTSIRARGMAKEGIAPDGRKGRIIEKLTHGTSIDYVTSPGAGGKVLQLFEAARAGGNPQQSEEGGVMDAEKLKKLEEANRNISKRLAAADARTFAEAALKSVRLPETAKVAIIEKVSIDAPITEAGDFDKTAMKAIVEAEIQYAARFIPGGVEAVGVGAQPTPDPKVAEAAQAKAVEDRKFWLNRSASHLHIQTEAGKRIFREGRAGFDPNYCSSDKRMAGAEV